MYIVKIIILFLFFVYSTVVFSANVDDIVKQQKNKAAEKAEEQNKEERKQEAMRQCREEVTKIVASKIKGLMDKGVSFKKDPGVFSYRNVGGNTIADGFGGPGGYVLTNMFENRLLVVSGFGTYIQFQPEQGKAVKVEIAFFKDGTWELSSYLKKYDVKFKSYYNIDEIKKETGNIEKMIDALIEDALK